MKAMKARRPPASAEGLRDRPEGAEAPQLPGAAVTDP